MLEQVLNAMPQLSSLAMTGIYYRHDLAMLIPILSRFEHLETLALAGAKHLWIGFNPSWSWGGCKHRLRSSPRIRERVDEERREANYKAARMCFGACKALEVLWIGDGTKATVVRDADGDVAVVDVVEGLQRPPVA